MKWDEFCDLLSGISAESPLGRMVQIRLEDDPKILEHFTPAQRKIRSQWKSKRTKTISPENTAQFLEQMKQAFISMSGK